MGVATAENKAVDRLEAIIAKLPIYKPSAYSGSVYCIVATCPVSFYPYRPSATNYVAIGIKQKYAAQLAIYNKAAFLILLFLRTTLIAPNILRIGCAPFGSRGV